MTDGQLLWRPNEGWSIGLDFGTAYSKAAATYFSRDSNAHRMIPLRLGAVAQARGALVVPSALFLNDDKIYLGAHAPTALLEARDEQREMLQSFKLALGVRDFEQALDLRLTRQIDPSGEFRRGDLIAIYLAYLLELIERAAPPDFGPMFGDSSKVRLRYSRPGWIPSRAAAAHAAMEKLFRIAAHVRLDIGPQLLSSEGLPTNVVKAALSRALSSAMVRDFPFAALDGSIYEASAVAACHFVARDAPDHLVVVDIGAGTTDFSGFVRHASGRIEVVPAAQRTIGVAGDVFDRALMNLLLSKATQHKTKQETSALWRALLANIRDLKEALLRDGKLSFEIRHENLKCRLSQFTATEDYRLAMGAIAEAFDLCLSAMERALQSKGARRIGLVLAGGGAHMPSVIEMARKAKSLSGGIKIDLLPTIPTWTGNVNSGVELKSAFAQMCVAFGAALSHPNQFQQQGLVATPQ
jgi:molecular chaperone DnaK (HSP70)